MNHWLKKTKLAAAVHGWPMRRKMTVLFSVPVLLIILLVYIPCSWYVQRRTLERQRINTEQAMNQAESFIGYYAQSLRYIAEQLNSSRELREILENPTFGKQTTWQDSYLEFWNLTKILQGYEVANGDFRIGIYVPEDASYANNDYNIYPISDLQKMEDYDEILDVLENDGIEYRIFQDKRSGNPNSRQDYLGLLRMIKVTGTDGTERSYIVKTEVRMEQLEDVLNNAAPTAGSSLFLVNEEGRCICKSAETEDTAWLSSLLENKSYRKPIWTIVNTGNGSHFVIHEDVSGTDWMIGGYIPVLEYYGQLGWLLAVVILTIVAVVLVVVLVSFHLSGFYTRRIRFLNGRMTDIGRDGLKPVPDVIPAAQSRDEMDVLYTNFDYMINEIRKLLKEEYRLGRDVSKMEVKALAAQINPHFLYNTLDLINWGALEHGAEDVAALARNLGQFYRLSLNHGSAAILIRDEIRHVKSFIDIENEHYDHHIEMMVDVPDDLQQYACLNITLQPFVENCIVHGMGEHPEILDCRIKIGAVKEDEDIIFRISDNGPGMDEQLAEQLSTQRPDGSGKGFGVANVNFRIKLVYGERYGVTYLTGSRKEDNDMCTMNKKEGTTVLIRIKALNMKELNQII